MRIKSLDPDVLIHFAVSPDIGQHISTYSPEFYNTLHSALNVLQAIPRNRECLFIHIGSYKQYGKIPVPFREIDDAKPCSSYGLAKSMVEELISLRENDKFKAVYLRLGSVFGPGQPQRALIPHTIYSILNDTSQQLKAASVPWDPIYISDAIDAILACTVQPNAWGKIINISRGEAWSPKEIMYYIARLLNKRIEPIELNSQLGQRLPLPCLGDISLAKNILNWEPKVSVHHGLKLTVESYLTSLV